MALPPEEGDLAGQRRPAHLNAAMPAVGGLGRRECQGGIVEEQLHVFKQRALIALERQHIGPVNAKLCVLAIWWPAQFRRGSTCSSRHSRCGSPWAGVADDRGVSWLGQDTR